MLYDFLLQIRWSDIKHDGPSTTPAWHPKNKPIYKIYMI